MQKPETREQVEEQYPSELSLEQVLVEHRKANYNPRIKYVSHTVLKEGPRNSRVATIFQIIDEHTGELHHYSLKLETVMHRKASGWRLAKENSITLGDARDGSNEIGNLMTFIASVTKGLLPDKDGRYVIIDSRNQIATELLKLLHSLNNSEQLNLALNVLSELGQGAIGSRELSNILENKEGILLRGIATASRLIEYRRAYEELRQMIEDPTTPESMLQNHLQAHPWMFGSEYSKLLDQRVWTRDDKQDFMLRRTVDGYLEIIEIKKPIKEPLLRFDSSHGTYYPSAGISLVIGQVMGYIEQLDRRRDSIIAQDGQDPFKIRARIIIGRDGSRQEQAALRMINSHLDRMEVLTFDQLLRIAARVLNVFEEQQEELVNEEMEGMISKRSGLDV